MAVKASNGHYYSGEVWIPGAPGPALLDELTDIRPGGYGRWMYCKYCYKNVLPVASYEDCPPFGAFRQALCSECGAGLTPSVSIAEATVGMGLADTIRVVREKEGTTR